MPRNSIVVIGSGPGGSAFAALMAYAGHRVTLLERNRFPGGRCSSFPRNGYVLDAGVHMFGLGPRGPFGLIGRTLGEGPSWCSATPAFTLNLPGRGNLEFTSSIAHPLSIFNLVEGRARGWIDLGLASTALKSLIELRPSGLRTLLAGMLDRRSPLFCDLEGMSVADFLRPLSDSEDFLRALHAQVMLTMVVPWHRASMGEFAYILCGMMRASNLCYPRGGTGAIARSFVLSMERRGGVYRPGCEAAVIEVDGGGVKGVTTSEGEFIPAEIVVSNAGLERTVELAGREAFPEEYLARVDATRDSEAFITLRYSLERRIESIRTPCLLRLPDLPPHTMFGYLEGGEVPDDLLLFVTAPGLWDASLVPRGGDCLVVGVPAPSRLDRPELENALFDLAEDIVADIFPELAPATAGIDRVSAGDISRLCGRRSGACIGSAQEVGQSGTSRMTSFTPVRGLFLVGADAGGRGIGTEMAADSAFRLYNLMKDGRPQ